MCYLSSGLLFILLVATAVNCQSCRDSAMSAIGSDQDCLIAFNDIRNAIEGNRSINQTELNSYCQEPSCRNLVSGVLDCSNNTDGNAGEQFNRFLCSTDNGMSCYDLLASGRFARMSIGFLASGVCEEDIPDGQECSPTCQAAFQNFVIDGGCCVAQVFESSTQFAHSTLLEIFQQCPGIDLSQGGTCVEIGGRVETDGASGLKAFVSVLLLAVALALASF